MPEKPSSSHDKYRDKTLSNPCPKANKNKRGKKKDPESIEKCPCKGCRNFRVNYKRNKTLSLISRRPFGLKEAAIGTVAILGLIGIFRADIKEIAKDKAPVATSTPSKSPREINESIITELQIKEVQNQRTIDNIELVLLPKLKSIQPSNPQVQKVLDSIINLIETNRVWKSRNLYTTAIRLLREKDLDQPFQYTFDGEERVLSSADDWCELINLENLWKFRPPFFVYGILNPTKKEAGHYSFPYGQLKLMPNLSPNSLIAQTLYIHELCHIHQAQNQYASYSAEQIQKMQLNMHQDKSQADGEIYLQTFMISDMETGAYAFSIEIANALSDGVLREVMLDCADTEAKKLKPKTEEQRLFVEEIIEGCPDQLYDSFFSVTTPYFHEALQYPKDHTKLEKTLTTLNPEKIPINSSTLYNNSRAELSQILQNRTNPPTPPSTLPTPPSSQR